MAQANGVLEGSEAGDCIAAVGLERLKGKGDLLPLLPIPSKQGVSCVTMSPASVKLVLEASFQIPEARPTICLDDRIQLVEIPPT